MRHEGQVLFSRKNKEHIISLSSAEFAHSMVSGRVTDACKAMADILRQIFTWHLI